MSITLTVPETSDVATIAPLAPVAGGEPVDVAGVTLAICARATSPADMRLCKLTSKGAYRQTGAVADIARAYTAGLLTV